MTTLSKRKENSSTDLNVFFTELVEFSNWADNRVINWLTQITDEQWNKTAISSFESIRDTAIHIQRPTMSLPPLPS
jgi:uncharacterized damage-inducible protein DinB